MSHTTRRDRAADSGARCPTGKLRLPDAIAYAARLALVGRHRLLRGEIDAEIIILAVVSVFILFGVAAWFFKW